MIKKRKVARWTEMTGITKSSGSFLIIAYCEEQATCTQVRILYTKFLEKALEQHAITLI